MYDVLKRCLHAVRKWLIWVQVSVSSMGPIHIIAIDFIEKLLPDDYGKNTLMSIIICTFSPFIEFFPAKDNSAKVAAQALLQHIG
jgi:hypothetical protein